MPLISVIVPCYNQAEYLDECLQSVLDQTYEDWECIIVNDGSPDNTEEVAKKWVKKDNRFKYFFKKNGGLSSARNAGIEIAKGEWIQFLDCDDILNDYKFEISLNLANSQNELIVTNFQLLDINGDIVQPFCDLSKYEINYHNILLRWDIDFNIPIHCGLFTKKSMKRLTFNEDLKSKEDWVFWLQYLTEPKSSLYIAEELVKYRINPKSVGTSSDLIEIANNFLYQNLTNENQKLFFEKINNQLLQSQLEFNNCNRALKKIERTKILKFYKKIRSIFY